MDNYWLQDSEASNQRQEQRDTYQRPTDPEQEGEQGGISILSFSMGSIFSDG